MKKYLAILLAFLFLINSGGFIILFYSVHNFVREEIFNSIRTGHYQSTAIVKFTINKKLLYRNTDKFLWKDENEFEFEGKLYDIIKITPDNDNLLLFCLNDLREEKLVKGFNNEINNLVNGNLKNSRVKTSVLNIISVALLKNSFKLFTPYKQILFRSFLNAYLIKTDLKIPSPPPKFS